MIREQLIAEGDAVAIGLSGGQDSFLLLDILAERKKHLPFPIRLCAIHVHLKEIGYEYNVPAMEKYCASLDIPFYCIEESVDLSINKEKTTCFICSWTRRKKLFETTHQLGYNKLALGHHADDAIETLLMNMIYHGSISSLPYRLKMFGGRLILIRPLLDLSKKQISSYSPACHPRPVRECPMTHNTRREQIKKLLEQMERLGPQTRKNLFRSMNNIFPEYLPHGWNTCIHVPSPEEKTQHENDFLRET